jgi:hypothetical protein
MSVTPDETDGDFCSALGGDDETRAAAACGEGANIKVVQKLNIRDPALTMGCVKGGEAIA